MRCEHARAHNYVYLARANRESIGSERSAKIAAHSNFDEARAQRAADFFPACGAQRRWGPTAVSTLTGPRGPPKFDKGLFDGARAALAII